MEKDLILNRAKSAAIARDFQTAIKLYKSLLKDDVSNVELLNLIGSNYVKLGDDEKALKYYEQIITFSSHNVDAMNSMGAIYRRLKRYSESINILQRALEEEKDTATVNYNLGFTYKEMGDFDDAISAFSSVVDENPSDVLAYNHLGSIYYQKKAYQKSISCFKRGLQVDPNHPILQYNLAKCYEAEKQYFEAVRCYEIALKARPGWIDALHDFSELLIKCQRTEEARGIVKRTIELNPNDARLYMLLGEVYLNEFDYDSAISTYKEADNMDENNIRILKGLAEALENGEEPQEAITVMDKILKLEPENKDVKKQYVHALLSAEEYERAYSQVDTLYKENGEDDAQILDLYGQYYICVDDEDNAKKYFDKIPTVDPNYSLYLLEAANRYSQIGKIHQAEELAKKYITKNPIDAKAYNSLGSIYSKKGDVKAAEETYNKGISISPNNVYAKNRIKTLSSMAFPSSLPQPLVAVKSEESASDVNGYENSNYGLEESGFKFSDIIGKAQQKYEEEQQKNETRMSGLNAEEFPENEVDFADFIENQEEVPPVSSIPDEIVVKEKDQYLDDISSQDLMKKEFSPSQFLTDYPKSASIPAATESPFAQTSIPVQPAQSAPEVSESSGKAAYNNPQEVIDTVNEAADMANQVAQKAMQSLQDLDEKIARQEAMLQDRIAQKEEEFQKREAELNAKEESLAKEEQLKKEEYQAKEEEILAKQEELKQAEMQAKESQDKLEEMAAKLPEAADEITEEITDEENYNEKLSEEIPVDDEKDFENEQAEFIIEEASVENAVISDEETETVKENTEELETLDDEVIDELYEVDDLLEVDEDLIQANIINEDAPFEDIISAAAEVAAENELSENKEDKIDTLEEADYSFLDPLETIRRFLPNVEKILQDTDYAHAHATELELFIKMKKFCEFLPENELYQYKTSRIRMLLDYLIARFSGKPGLLATAESLMKGGFLGEGVWEQLYENQVNLPFDEQVKVVLNYMKGLTRNLHSQNIAQVLRTEADNVLEKLELNKLDKENQ